MSMKYKYLEFDGEEFLTVYIPGESPLLASRESHANFDRLLELAKAKDESVVDEFDTGRAVEKAFADVVEGRVAVRGGVVFFDDDPQDGAITKAILRFLEEGSNVSPLVKFMENVMANPQEESREQFFRWIEHHDFPIDDDGHIVAFKGVRGSEAAGYTSISRGEAFVNGENHVGAIPNALGDIVTMPRSEVQHDPHVACHKGLHAGTWEYASDFAQGAVMHVRINPRDVVSVPHDCTSQKVRVCRYEVIGFAEAGYDGAHWKVESDVVEEPVVEEEPAKVDGVFEVGDRVRIKADYSRTHVRVARLLQLGALNQVGVVHSVHTDSWRSDGMNYAQVELDRNAKLVDGGVWFTELEHVTDDTTNSGVRDTRENHKFQQRDARGHFIKKV